MQLQLLFLHRLLKHSHLQPSLKTYAIIDAVPNPVGVGEEMLIRTGIIQATGDASYGWTGITVIVTKPDGTNQTLGPFTTDSTGATFTQFTLPTKLAHTS